MQKAIIITGPTASGKTSLSIELAKTIGGEMISADSMQIYRSMDIGTAKPSIEEQQGIPHHLINIACPTQDFNVVLYCEMAKKCIKEITSRGKIPIIVGGTGLYINSLVYNIHFTETKEDPELRKELSQLATENGNQYIHDILATMDPAAAVEIHPNNVKRVIRAIEVFKLTGIPRSINLENSRKISSEIDFLVIGLDMERSLLYERINQRVENMISDGLVDEVKSLLENHSPLSKTAVQAIGYKEIIDFLNGSFSLEECKEIIKRNSRNYAKRQMTWLKKLDDINWLSLNRETEANYALGNTLSLVGKFWEIR